VGLLLVATLINLSIEFPMRTSDEIFSSVNNDMSYC
jgi:hypothetical protein